MIVYNLHGLDHLLSSVVLFCYCFSRDNKFSDRFCHYLHNRNALNSVTLPMMNKNNRRFGWERHFRKPTRCNAAIQLNIIYYNSTGVKGFFFFFLASFVLLVFYTIYIRLPICWREVVQQLCVCSCVCAREHVQWVIVVTGMESTGARTSYQYTHCLNMFFIIIIAVA